MKPWKILLSIAIALALGLAIFGPFLFVERKDVSLEWKGKTLPAGEVFDSKEKKQKISELLTTDKNILSFWATWCAPCVHEMPRIEESYLDLKSAGINLILLNLDQGHPPKVVAEVPAWIISQKLSLETFFDFHGHYLESLSLNSLPVHIGVSREGRVLWIEEGEIEWKLADIQKRF